MPGAHSVLGVSLHISERVIRSAYRSKAKLLHPDKDGGSVEAKEEFIALQKAFEELTTQKEAESEPVQSGTTTKPSHH